MRVWTLVPEAPGPALTRLKTEGGRGGGEGEGKGGDCQPAQCDGGQALCASGDGDDVNVASSGQSRAELGYQRRYLSQRKLKLPFRGLAATERDVVVIAETQDARRGAGGLGGEWW